MSLLHLTPVHLHDTDHVVDIVVGVTAALSIIGSSSIIAATLLFYRLQKHFFSLRLILFLSLCDLIYSCAFLTGIISSETGWWAQQYKSDAACIIQASFLQYFAIAGILWMTCFAHSLWRSVRKKTYNQIQQRKANRKYELVYHAICWCLPVIPLFILAPLDLFGPTGSWCWVTDDTQLGEIMRFALFYVPLWIAMLFSGILYVLILIQAKNQILVHRVSLYILVFMIVWVPATADRLVEWLSGGGQWYWLHVTHAAVQSLQGFLNSIVYGFSLGSFQEAIKTLLPLWSTTEQSLIHDSGYRIDTIAGHNADDFFESIRTSNIDNIRYSTGYNIVSRGSDEVLSDGESQEVTRFKIDTPLRHSSDDLPAAQEDNSTET